MKITLFLLLNVASFASNAKTMKSSTDIEKCFSESDSWYGYTETTKTKSVEKSRYIQPEEAKSRCAEDGIAMVSKNKKEAQKVAEAIGKNYNWSDALPAYEVAIANDKNICRDQNLQYAVTNAFGQTDAGVIKLAQKIAFTNCWPDIKSAVLKVFDADSGGSYFYDNACPDLAKLNVLNDVQHKKCVTMK